jgi:Na+/H+-dicarboxylate symporter
MADDATTDAAPPAPMPDDEPSIRPFGVPLYIWVLLAVALAVPLALFLGMDAERARGWPTWVLRALRGLVFLLDLMPLLIIRALTALAAPLIVLAILSAIVTNEVRGRQGLRMMMYYLINTIVAMAFGLTLTNLIVPGRGAVLSDEASPGAEAAPERLIDRLTETHAARPSAPAPKTLRDLVTDLIPRNIVEAFLQNNLAQIVLVTLLVAIALARLRDRQRARGETAHRVVIDLLTVGFEVLMRVLLWVVALVPLAVFGVVATSLAREGFALIRDLGWFILTVLAGLACQLTWYLLQLSAFARISPARFLRGAADVMAATFSSASTAATIPITLRALQGKLGVTRQSSQLAACVGTNFNNDGTALYQAVAALFFAQALGVPLSWSDQLVIMLTTLFASVGAGGIPSGSFVTMPLIFAAVHLPAEKLPILLTIDWFLDRCRTTSNVLGDMTVAILLDRTEPAAASRGAAS